MIFMDEPLPTEENTFIEKDVMSDTEMSSVKRPDPNDSPETLVHLRDRVTNLVLKVLAVIILVPLAGSLYRATVIGWQPVMLFHVLAVISIYTVYIFRGRLLLTFKSWFLVVIFMLVGIAGLINMGVFAAALYLMTFGAVMTTALIGQRVGLVVFGISALSIVLVAVAYLSGYLTYPFDPTIFQKSPTVWINLLGGFILANALILAVVGVMNRSFIRSIDVLQRRERELEDEVAEREKAQKDLYVSEKNYHEIFDASSEAIFILKAPSGAILNVNQGMLDMFGYSYDEVRGLTAQDLSSGDPPYSQQEAAEWIKKALEKGSIRFEWLAKRKNGELFWAEVYFKCAHIGETEKILAALRDITERKESEKEIERYQNHLEDVVSERTSQLEEAQTELVGKEKLATLGQLTGMVSQELRNPLGTVRNAMFSIAEGIEGDDKDRVLRSVTLAERNVKRCDNIIHELLYFTQKPEIDPRKVYIDAWVGILLEEQELPDEIELVFNLKSGIELSIGRASLRRAVINLLDNAVQACMENGSNVKRVLIETKATRDRLEIRVVDNGPGIPEGIKDSIFEPLFTTKSFGVGLGLPMVKNIMEGHDGGIEIESKEGEGMTVTLWMPIST